MATPDDEDRGRDVGGFLTPADAQRRLQEMKRWDRHAKMDQMETLNDRGWQFLCAGEQLPSGSFQATVRHRVPPDDELRTLVLDREQHATAGAALQRAKALAMKWADEHDAPGRTDA